MRASASCKLPTGTQYEMLNGYFEMLDTDIPVELNKELSLTERWCFLQYEVQRQCLLFKFAGGYLEQSLFVKELDSIESLFLDAKLKKLREQHGV